MIRFIGFLLFLTAICVASFWMAQQPGSLHLIWLGYEIETSVAVLLFVLMGVGLLAFFLGTFVEWLRQLPARYVHRHRENRHQKAVDAVYKALLHIAAGEGSKALKYAERVQSGMQHTALPLVLKAESALLAGKEEQAHQLFDQLTTNPDTAFLGYRGLVTQLLKEQKWHQALPYAQKAYILQPKSVWAVEVLYELALRCHAFQTALDVLPKVSANDEEIARNKPFHDAAIRLHIAYKTGQSGEVDLAASQTRKVLQKRPGFYPALAYYLNYLQNQGHYGEAARVLEKFWQEVPRLDVFSYWIHLQEREDDLPIRKALKLAEKATTAFARYAAQGLVWQALDNHQKAIEMWRRALEEKKHPQVLHWLMESLRVQGGQDIAQLELPAHVSLTAYETDDGEQLAFQQWCARYIDDVYTPKAQDMLMEMPQDLSGTKQLTIKHVA